MVTVVTAELGNASRLKNARWLLISTWGKVYNRVALSSVLNAPRRPDPWLKLLSANARYTVNRLSPSEITW